jgi:hypothetical protein
VMLAILHAFAIFGRDLLSSRSASFILRSLRLYEKCLC